MWIEYQNNPFGLRVGDCVIRAISKALDKSWEETYVDLCVQGFMMGDLPSSNSIWSAYLKHKGFKRRTIENCPDCYSIEDFCQEHPNGVYVIGTCKIEMLEEDSEGGYSEARGGRGRGRSFYDGGSSYDDDMMYSERRGRGRNAKRDSMGRYSSEGGSYEGGYSRNDAKDWMMSQLGEMMEDADPKEREALKECMRAIERA